MNIPPAAEKSPRNQFKRWLPYLILAAITINSFIFLIFIDFVQISTMSFAQALNIPMTVTPVVRAAGDRILLRDYANVILLGITALLAVRSYRRTS